MTMFRLATRTPVHEIVRDLAVPHLGADYLPIVGARFVFADHRDVYAPPFDHVPSVSFGIDAFDVPGVDSNDYLGPAAEMLVSLIDRSDIDSGVPKAGSPNNRKRPEPKGPGSLSADRSTGFDGFNFRPTPVWWVSPHPVRFVSPRLTQLVLRPCNTKFHSRNLELQA